MKNVIIQAPAVILAESRNKEAFYEAQPLTFWLIVAACVVLVFVAVSIWWYEETRKKSLYEFFERIEAQEFVSMDEFLLYYVFRRPSRDKAAIGLKYMDQPGCYLLYMFKEPVTDGRYDHPWRSYIGKGPAVYAAVNAQLHCNGDRSVSGDIRHGKIAYVKILSCPSNELDAYQNSIASECGCRIIE